MARIQMQISITNSSHLHLTQHYFIKNKNSKQGFTLIEVLIVMVIIGIIAGTAIISYSPNPYKKYRDELYLLLDRINYLQETALLESTPYGVLLFEKRYRIVTIKNNTWVDAGVYPITDLDLSEATLEINQSSVDIPNEDFVDKIFPQIIMSPGAEMTPFYLSVRRFEDDNISSVLFEITSDILGHGKLKETR